MPRLKISELTQTTSPSGTDVFPIVSDGVTKKVKLTTISGFIVPNAQDAVQPLLDLKANLNGDNITASTFRTALGATATGTSVLTAASAAAARTAIGAVIGTDVQAYSANLDEYAAVNPTAAGLALLDDANASAQRTTLGLAIGTDVQAYDADLSAIAALTSAADKMPYSTGAQTWAMADLTSFARTLLAGANQAAFLAALGQIDNVYTNFVQAGTGAVTITTQAKLRQASVQPNSGEFGAFTDATTTTATLLAAFTHAMSLGRVVELAGSYTINGPITPPVAVDGAELRIFLRDDVTITVDAGATHFNRVFYAESTTPISHSISGNGSLLLDCNNKAAAGFWLRHTASSTGGSVMFNAPVHVKNITGTATYLTSAGIIVLGRYERVLLRSPTVEDVTRSDASGESSGISISGFDGEVEMYNPVVRRVYYGPGTGDADCIKCFGRQSGTANNRREGSVRIYNPVLEDGQVRLYKDQCGDTVIYRPWCRRRGVDGTAGSFAASSSIDFDFQFGGGLVMDAHIEYYKSATGVSPLGSSHSVVAFQQVVDNSEMVGAIRNTTLISDVIVSRFALLAEGGSTSSTVVDGLNMIPVNGFTTTMLDRGLLEFTASEVGAKTTGTDIVVKNTNVPSNLPVIAYTSYSSLDSGTATAGSAITLTNSAETWTTNQWAGCVVRITAGTGSGQMRTITSNTGTVLTVASPWAVNPDATSVYSIWYSFSKAPFATGTATAGAATTLTDGGKSFTTNIWAGLTVLITSGTGVGQIRTITSNTGTVLTVSPAWTTNPDTSSQYAVTFAPSVTGTATSGGASTLTDSGAAWTVNAYAGLLVLITGGTGAGQTRTIASNTATALTLSTVWTTNPDATSTYAIIRRFGPKLSLTVDKCETTLAVTGQGTRAFASISGDEITDPASIMFGDNPGYRNFYGLSLCLKTMRAGCKLIIYLDDTDTHFVDTDLNTAVSVPWGTTGNLYLHCSGISNYGTATHDTIIEARLNNAATAGSAWFTQYGGVAWGALN